jgi:hypothetical protein
MEDPEIPAELIRVGLASEAVKQAKYKRWAAEMEVHGWTVHQPSPRKIRALALQDARKRFEKSISDAGREAAR